MAVRCNLAQIRRDRALTLRELAEGCGVSAATLNRIEKGAVLPHLESVRRLCDWLHVQAVDLWPAYDSLRKDRHGFR